MAQNDQHLEETFTRLSAHQRIETIFDLHSKPEIMQSCSFGLQSSALLSLVAEVAPGTPVFFVNTGYLFPETLDYIDSLSKLLSINLFEIRPRLNPQDIHTKYGQLWMQGEAGLNHFNEITKLSPMKKAIADNDVKAWISGIRKVQSKQRQCLPFVTNRYNAVKYHPILDWDDRQIYEYIKSRNLPLHPLSGQGYVSVGDTVTTKSLNEVNKIEQTRFMGVKRECGLHY